MNSSTRRRTPLSVYPVLIAFAFNMLMPVASVALPVAGPGSAQPANAAANDPSHVNFTLQGCRNPSVNLEATNFVCADVDYTTGNLGKTWNELDLVPHRLTTALGTQAAASENYRVAIVADRLRSGIPGYDVITAPVVNAAKSHASCAVSASDQLSVSPGLGSADTSIYRLLDISQAKGSTCVFDYVERLAIGSHQYPGSSLHSNLTNQNLGTAGVGSRDVSIPVKEILPQQLDKTMAAARGQEFTWSVTKSADPTALSFPNTCGTADSRTASVNVTVSWTRSGPSASGDTEITTNIYVTNPAHRSVTVQVTDHIYEGANQSVLLDTATSAAVDVPAGSVDFLILTHTFTYGGSATTFNDVATATYTDTDLGIAIPGQTTATASTTTILGGDALNESGLITDSESITGSNLLFSVAQPSIGSFAGYTAGTQTTGPVDWSYQASGSGSVTFNKTVIVSEPSITSGTLSDTAQILDASQAVLASASLNVGITASAQVELTIVKSIAADALREGESVTFTFQIEGPGNYDQERTITFNHGEANSKSVVISGLAPGSYTVTEKPTSGWQTDGNNPQIVDLTLPVCSGSATFGNELVPADLDIEKTTTTPIINAGDGVNYTITVTNGGAGTAQDVVISDTLPSGISWSENSADCEIVGATLSCGPLDIAGNSSFSVTLTGVTDAGDCPSISNWASYSSRNAGSGSTESEPTVITVNCPDLSVVKTGSSIVSAGDSVSYSITVTNGGDGDAYDATLADTLPAVTGGWTLGGADADDCQLVGLDLSCDFGTLASGASKSITLSATTSAADCGELANTATVSASNEPADALANNEDSHTITVDCPELQITKVADNSVVSAGEDIGFTITVTNLGPGKAHHVTLTDALPGDLAWTGDSADCQIVNNTLDCDFGTLNAGASASVHVSAPTTRADCATLENTAFADASNDPGGPVDASDQVTIECPGLNIAKTADSGVINAGDQAAFEVTIWNAGPGQAFDVSFSDTVPGTGWSLDLLNPDDDDACIGAVVAGEDQEEWSCTFGTLDPSAMADGKVIRLTKTTAFADCGLLDNTAFASASNNATVDDSATIRVDCPEVAIAKVNDATESVLPGAVVSFSLEVSVSNATAEGEEVAAFDVVVTDLLPEGYDAPTTISDGGSYEAASRTIIWNLGDLGAGTYGLSYQAAVSTDAEHGAALVNVAFVTSSNSQCPDEADLAEECVDDSTVTVRVPTLVIDKAASVEQVSFTLDEAGNVTSIDPAVVTWTLSWTLANGPVSNALISDPIPAFLTYVEGSASDGGVFDAAANTLSWTFASLSESGSVTFQTSVNEEADGEIVNVATIVSDQTPEDEGVDSITVTEQVVLGPTPTPAPKIPDTAASARLGGQTAVVWPVALLALLFGGSLGALAAANVKAARRRR